jgi:hypothetical protein
VLAGRLLAAMDEAWRKTVKHPLREVGFRATPLVLPPREDAGFSRRELEALLANPAAAFDERARAAYALSWRARADAGRKLDLPALDFGCASLLLLPGEPFVEYQLAAQKLCPERFVMVLGYGDYGPVYIPTARAYEEGGYEPGEWSFVSPAAERALLDGMERALSR